MEDTHNAIVSEETHESIQVVGTGEMDVAGRLTMNELSIRAMVARKKVGCPFVMQFLQRCHVCHMHGMFDGAP